MKKKFGWFFIILGILNLFVSFNATTAHGSCFYEFYPIAEDMFIFGIIILALGAWMVSSSKPRDNKDNEWFREIPKKCDGI